MFGMFVLLHYAAVSDLTIHGHFALTYEIIQKGLHNGLAYSIRASNGTKKFIFNRVVFRYFFFLLKLGRDAVRLAPDQCASRL